MKTKKLRGKLNFQKTTIVTLDNQAKNGVVGGKPSYSECGTICSCDTACYNDSCGVPGCVTYTIQNTCNTCYEISCPNCPPTEWPTGCPTLCDPWCA